MGDGNGRKNMLTFTRPPRRVVSLVPSMTESMFDLGFGDALVGITNDCTRPVQAVGSLPRVGRPKNPRTDEIIALKPELVLANWEENTRQTVETLEANGIRVWVTFPKTVRQALDVLWTLVGLFNSPRAAARLETLEVAYDWTKSAAADHPRLRYFCPIWQDQTSQGLRWWMTFNRDTYCHDLLWVVGGMNIFADRERRYPLDADLGLAEAQAPGERDTRYPRVTLEEIRQADPQVILLPDEPYGFSEANRQELLELLSDCTAVLTGRVHLVDGSLITWHGSRLAHALRELPGLFSSQE